MTFSASWRQHVTWTNSEPPSTHSPPACERRRAVLAIRNFATTSPLGNIQPFTAVATLPTTVTWVSNIVRLLGPGHRDRSRAAHRDCGRGGGPGQGYRGTVDNRPAMGTAGARTSRVDRSCRCLVVGRSPRVFRACEKAG